MKLFEVIKNIKKICYTIPNVNQVIEGDVYDLNKLKDIKYSCMVITEQSHSTDIDNSYVTYGLNIFYVDRALSDGSNELDVHSHAIDALNVVISAIEDMGGIITNNYVIQTFKERFGDVCFGAFATINARFDIDECDSIKLVTSVNGQTGDVIINTEGVSVAELNQRLKKYNTKTEDDTKFQPKGNYATKSELNDYAKKSETPSFLDIPKKLSELENDSDFVTSGQVYSKEEIERNYAHKYDIPTNVSSFYNDAGYVNFDGLDYEVVKLESLISKKANIGDVPTKTSDLTNDSEFVISGQVYSKEEVEAQFAKKSETPSYLDIPTKLSQLENDSDFLISGQTYDKEEINAQFVKKSELPTVPTKLSELENNVGFVTYDTVDRDFQQKGNYAYKNELPTKTSELTNDSGFLTEHQELKTINGESIVGSGNITIEGGDSNVVIFNLEDVTISDLNSAIEEGKEILIREYAGFGYFDYNLMWGEPDYYVFSRFFENEEGHGRGQKLLYFPGTGVGEVAKYDVEWIELGGTAIFNITGGQSTLDYSKLFALKNSGYHIIIRRTTGGDNWDYIMQYSADSQMTFAYFTDTFIQHMTVKSDGSITTKRTYFSTTSTLDLEDDSIPYPPDIE